MRPVIVLAMLFLFPSLQGQKGDRVMDSLSRVATDLSNPGEAITARAQMATRLYNQGNLKRAEALLEEAFQLSRTHNSEKGLGSAYNTQGSFFFYKGLYDSALHAFNRSLYLRKKIADKHGELKTLGNIGAIHFMKSDPKRALNYYEEALRLESELKYPEGTQVSLNNIANIYFRLRMLPQTLSYYRKAEKVYAGNRNTSQLSVTYDGLSSLYQDLDKLDSARYFINRSRELAEQENDLSGLAYAYTNLALIYKKQKQNNLAIGAFGDALRRATILKDKRLQIGIYGNLAALYIEHNDLDAGMVYLEKLIPLQKELNYAPYENELAEIFAEYYFRKKDYQNAYKYLKRFISARDSMYNLETTKQLTEMQEKYQTEKKEKENQLLQVENRTHKSVRNYLLMILGIALAAIIGSVFAYRKIKHSKSVISQQKELVDEKQKEILDSIRYAKRIQFALLASDKLLKAHLPDHFVFFRPKDVVSGDFYWGIPSPDGFIYVTGDCTGHGVPGAFMSLLNISKLSEVIVEQQVVRPDLILNRVRNEIIRALNPEGSTEESRDGMDAVVCKLDTRNMKLEFAAANNSFYIIRKGSILTCKADKMPVGKSHDEETPFTFNEVALEKGDTIYTFTDGFADQFGGSLGKKFKYKQLEELLLSINHYDLQTQRQKLSETFDRWKGGLEQVDDVCLIGVRV
jgi:serine phosphatase RsbU (regulator of sigma subunit)